MERIKLSEIAYLLNGYAFKSAKYVERGIRIIRIANVQDGYIADENLIRYHTALAFVDHIQAEGFIGAADRKAMYALIAQRYGIDKDSIFAA